MASFVEQQPQSHRDTFSNALHITGWSDLQGQGNESMDIVPVDGASDLWLAGNAAQETVQMNFLHEATQSLSPRYPQLEQLTAVLAGTRLLAFLQLHAPQDVSGFVMRQAYSFRLCPRLPARTDTREATVWTACPHVSLHIACKYGCGTA